MVNSFYEVCTTSQSKDINAPTDSYRSFDQNKEKFSTLDEVRAHLANKYSDKMKKEKMYVDHKNGAKHIGHIYTFRNSDISHNSKPWMQQDWVTIYEVNATPVIV